MIGGRVHASTAKSAGTLITCCTQQLKQIYALHRPYARTAKYSTLIAGTDQ